MNTQNQTIRATFASFLALAAFATTLVASNEKQFEDATLNEQRFGPYVALSIDSNIVKNDKINEDGRIHLLLNLDYKEK